MLFTPWYKHFPWYYSGNCYAIQCESDIILENFVVSAWIVFEFFTAKPLSFAYIAQQAYAILYFLPNVEYHYCDIQEKLTETKAVYLHVFGDDAVLTKMWHNCTVTIQLMQYTSGQTVWITSISRWLRFLVNLTGK